MYVGYGKEQPVYSRMKVPVILSKSCAVNGVSFVDCSQVLKGDFEANFSSDNKHPNNLGQTLLCGRIYEALNGGEDFWGYPQTTFNLTFNGKNLLCAFNMCKGVATLKPYIV